ncbi:pyridoxamine 5'-phosphate oxidase family protein [Hyphococcus flavus]|uniref:Pyridoxamine 5'-phosphate oxidase family protein n=1 Tax=Hyphococcus flavus TaxID=1866326 RepID=A0AAE9ZF21_9PROT|nr:pyridoxamine 5'-phosphate oxidase family protein [Hyphococcus flavus]WDI31668.1 pyridoxamine 5'-phosphate oxidase family protein [Hyphococcus flavus]
MAEFFDRLQDDHKKFIANQPMFFVATAAADGRINLSPKGQDTFRVFSDTTCAYLDLTGSGNETAAHIKRDGRITVMFNSFDKKPLILRLYGRGRAVASGEETFVTHQAMFPELPGARQIIFIDIESVQTSCGYAVPEMSFVSERHVLRKWSTAKGEDGIRDYWREKNTTSIDGFETGLLVDKE